MAQNIYDIAEFYEGYSTLPRSVHGLSGAPEWPSVRELLPDIAGKRIVDLGCGFGWFAQWAAAQGATSVLGLDLSENMLAKARAETTHAGVRYERADLDTLTLPAAAFDLAYSSLAFHYVQDFCRLAGTIYRSLLPGSHFVFTIEHPIYMASASPGWMLRQQETRTWPVDHYAEEGERRTDWFAKGVVKYHRRLATTVNALVDAGFSIRHLNEWSPTSAQLEEQPALIDEMERPMILIVAAQT
ncbi:class I SAM-dependent methyltransferase [Rhizobium sp. LC145]|uniref:class I SAM-dependent methyltransferase n=1 Tax=Rhizobium sp. LC145 TaxID=1120688 RepID=UPI00062A3685|nr:class I SAM-dependent methyltransferase [Rhizobium sp. LC145]KKX33388.1 SAM-dependent methyltransferase [Rhizobium sp. LC145]TKT58636.1 class I SAM-dependent methyltransferase [Rhizobiaceae bacterium LC148]